MEVSCNFFCLDCGLRSNPARSDVRVKDCSEVVIKAKMVSIKAVVRKEKRKKRISKMNIYSLINIRIQP